MHAKSAILLQLTESSFAWHVMNAQKTMEQKSSDD